MWDGFGCVGLLERMDVFVYLGTERNVSLTKKVSRMGTLYLIGYCGMTVIFVDIDCEANFTVFSPLAVIRRF